MILPPEQLVRLLNTRTIFERNGNAHKRVKLDSTGAFEETIQNVTEATNVVTLEMENKKHIQFLGNFYQTWLSENGGNCVGKWIGSTIKQ